MPGAFINSMILFPNKVWCTNPSFKGCRKYIRFYSFLIVITVLKTEICKTEICVLFYLSKYFKDWLLANVYVQFSLVWSLILVWLRDLYIIVKQFLEEIPSNLLLNLTWVIISRTCRIICLCLIGCFKKSLNFQMWHRKWNMAYIIFLFSWVLFCVTVYFILYWICIQTSRDNWFLFIEEIQWNNMVCCDQTKTILCEVLPGPMFICTRF